MSDNKETAMAGQLDQHDATADSPRLSNIRLHPALARGVIAQMESAAATLSQYGGELERLGTIMRSLRTDTPTRDKEEVVEAIRAARQRVGALSLDLMFVARSIEERGSVLLHALQLASSEG